MDEFKKTNLVNRLDDKVLTVNFTCQRCCQPLQIHKTFNTIDQNGLNTFTQLNFDDEDDEELKNEFENYKNFPYLVESGLNINDFLMVDGNTGAATTETTSSRNSNLSNSSKQTKQSATKKTSSYKHPVDDLNYNLKVTSKLFDVLSDQSTVNHPLCEDCADFIIDTMDNQLKVLEDECKVYKEFLENLEKAKMQNATENDVNELKEEIEKCKKEEQDLIECLESTIDEKKSMEKEIEKQHDELVKVNEEANKSWCEYNYFKKRLFDCEDELRSLDNQLKYAETHLDKVKNTNIFASAFHIWHDGHFGTINGLRLGRLPTFSVEWSEINAAWGQVVLLLHSLAKKINLVFERYKLVPYGNHSFIQSLDQKKDLPL